MRVVKRGDRGLTPNPSFLFPKLQFEKVKKPYYQMIIRGSMH